MSVEQASHHPTIGPLSEQLPSSTDRDKAREAAAAVHVGLYVSATRCILTYVVAPALGAFGLLLGPIGLLLQLLGAVTATAGARRLWVLKHRLRVPYVLVAASVDAITMLALVNIVGRARS